VIITTFLHQVSIHSPKVFKSFFTGSGYSWVTKNYCTKFVIYAKKYLGTGYTGHQFWEYFVLEYINLELAV